MAGHVTDDNRHLAGREFDDVPKVAADLSVTSSGDVADRDVEPVDMRRLRRQQAGLQSVRHRAHGVIPALLGDHLRDLSGQLFGEGDVVRAEVVP